MQRGQIRGLVIRALDDVDLACQRRWRTSVTKGMEIGKLRKGTMLTRLGPGVRAHLPDGRPGSAINHTCQAGLPGKTMLDTHPHPCGI